MNTEEVIIEIIEDMEGAMIEVIGLVVGKDKDQEVVGTVEIDTRQVQEIG